MKKGGRIPWNVIAICETFIQDLLSDGKTPHERRFGIPFNGPGIPFGAMVEYHTISAEDLSRLHQFVHQFVHQFCLARYIPWIRLVRGGNLERRHYGRRIEELEEMDASELHARRLNAKEVLTPM